MFADAVEAVKTLATTESSVPVNSAPPSESSVPVNAASVPVDGASVPINSAPSSESSVRVSSASVPPESSLLICSALETPKKRRSQMHGRKAAPKKIKRVSKKKNTESANSGDNTPCGYCGQRYNAAGEKANDDWLQCMECSMWLHETCAEVFGVIGDDDFFCSRCCE